MNNYKILASQKEGINFPSIWVQDENQKFRNLARIKTEDGKTVWVEIQIIDPNFRKNYNNNQNTLNIKNDEPVIVANEWYRSKLNIETKKSYRLEIYTSKSNIFLPLRQMQAALNHPDSSVRICVILAIVSVVLGLLGLILGVISLF